MKQKMVVVFSIFMSYTILFTMCGLNLQAETNITSIQNNTIIAQTFAGEGKADVTDFEINSSDTAVLTPTPTPTPIIITYTKEITIDGYEYFLWKDKGTAGMTLKEGGRFSCQWSDAGDVCFRTGKNLNEVKTYKEIGDISLKYDCNFQPKGSSYLAVYVCKYSKYSFLDFDSY